MAADLSTSAYLVDGVDIAVAGTAELLHDGAGLWSGLTETIGRSKSAGIDGSTIAGGTFDEYVHSTMYEITAPAPKAVWAAVVALRRRCKAGQTVTLTRVMPDPDGTDANVSHTTTARRQSDRPAWVGRNNRLQIDIDWLVTGGPWLGAEESIASVAGTQSIKGDLRTRLITATLSAGAADPVVTNSTNGYSFRYVGTVPPGDVEVDVLTRRATGLTGAVDLSANLRWSKSDPFQLDPGDNVITVSAGTCALDYFPAYQ